MLLGIVGNPPEGRSEREAWKIVYDFAEEVSRNSGVTRPNRVLAIRDLAWKMMRQANRGVHVNGRERGGRKMSDHVQAIVYTHEEDGQFYVHGFGDADLKLSVRGGALRIEGLEDRTNVQMFAQNDGSVKVVGKDGQNLWEDFG